jgi:hypothetical protein
LPNGKKKGVQMDKLPWKAGIEKLQEDDITMQEVYQGYIDDVMMDYSAMTMTDARIIVRHALNRATTGRVVREEIAYYMEHGEFRK